MPHTCVFPVICVCELLHVRWCCIVWKRDHEEYGPGIACHKERTMQVAFVFESQLVCAYTLASCSVSALQWR